MSLNNCYRRVLEQSLSNGTGSYAFLMKSKQELVNIVPDTFVDQIHALGLPGLVFHPDHIQQSHDIIRMQLYEGFLAVVHESGCITNTIFERFFQLPVAPIRSLSPSSPVSSSHETSPRAASTPLGKALFFLRDLPKAGVHALFTWSTMKDVVYNMFEASQPEYLGSRIR